MPTLPYVTFYGPAIALLLALGWRRFVAAGLSREETAALLALSAVGAVVGARTLMFDFHAPEPGEKTLLGALAGGMVMLAVGGRFLRFALGRLFDLSIVAILWSAALGRIGCFFSGCCHGIATSLPIGVTYGPGSVAFHDQVARGQLEAGAAAAVPVHPTQLYEAAMNVALALFLGRYRGRRPGDAALLGIIGLASVRFAVDPLRATAVPTLGLTLVQWTTLAVACATAAMLVIRRRQSIPRAYTPRRSVRGAPALVACAAALVTISLSGWLTPLEMLVLLPTVLGSVAVALRMLARPVTSALPLAGLTALMPLQLQDSPSPDTNRVVEYVAIGGGGMLGGYQVTTENCDGQTTSRTEHDYSVGALSGEYRRETAPGVGVGARVSVFAGNDRADRPQTYSPSLPYGMPDRPVTYPVRGISASLERDFRWVGLGVGVITGEWIPAYDMPVPEGSGLDQLLPVASLRLGSRTALHGEIGLNTHLPAPVPGPVGNIGLAVGDPTATRFFRFGVTDLGVYVGGTAVSRGGVEFQPVALMGSEGRFQLGATFRKRFYRVR